jgi:hypothetical protein
MYKECPSESGTDKFMQRFISLNARKYFFFFFFLQSLFTSMFHCRLAVLHAKNFFLQVLVLLSLQYIYIYLYVYIFIA